MEASQIKEYLKVAIDMEQSIYIQERTLENYPAFKAVKYHLPNYPNKPKAPDRPVRSTGSTDGSDAGAAFVLLILGLVVFGLGYIFYHSAQKEVPFWVRWQDSENIILLLLDIPSILIGMLYLYWPLMVIGGAAVIGCVGYLLYLPFSYRSDRANSEKMYAAAMEKWKIENEEYKLREKAYNEQYEQIKQKREAIQRAESEQIVQSRIMYDRERKGLQNQLIQTRSNLQKLYALDIVFPKYRNLPMLCSLYEYFCAGRCTSLEGHEGGYNILESEMRLDRIVTQMDRVISNLGQIQQNQYLLHATMQDSVRRTDQLVASTKEMITSASRMTETISQQGRTLEDIHKNSAITAYCLEENRKELEYMKRYL